jgi:hypothetical protein
VGDFDMAGMYDRARQFWIEKTFYKERDVFILQRFDGL